MANFTIDYTSGDKTLSVKPVDELFEIVNATISNEVLSPYELKKLVCDAELTYSKEVASEYETTATADSGSAPIPNAFTTPTKTKPSQVDDVDSPTCISAVLDEVPITLHNNKFIDILASTFFGLAVTAQPLVEPHTPILLSIEGNIGAGKSTLLRALREAHPDWTFIDEPVDTWTQLTNDKGNLLANFYGDQERWAYTFQNCSILRRFQLIEEAIKDNSHKYAGKHIYVTERSLGTDYHVFAKMLRDDGKMDELEFDLYERWLAELERQTCFPLSGIVLVDTSPAVCAERILKRCRDGEDGIPLSYLERLNTFQSRWLDNIDIPCKKTCTQEGIESFVEDMLSR